MRISKNRKGETDSVFRLALVVIIVAAVLAVVAYLMGSVWTGTETLTSGAATAADDMQDNTDCLTKGENCKEGGLGAAP